MQENQQKNQQQKQKQNKEDGRSQIWLQKDSILDKELF